MTRIRRACGHTETVTGIQNPATLRRARRRACLNCRYRKAMCDPLEHPFSRGNKAQIALAGEIRRRQLDSLAATIIRAGLRREHGVVKVLWNIRHALRQVSDPVRVIEMRDAWNEIIDRYKESH